MLSSHEHQVGTTLSLDLETRESGSVFFFRNPLERQCNVIFGFLGFGDFNVFICLFVSDLLHSVTHQTSLRCQ